MSYQVRLLPPEEWSRLAGTDLEASWPGLNRVNTRVVVVECDGAIVATLATVRVAHVHGLWIAPSHRHSAGVGSRLLQGLRKVASDWSMSAVVTEDLPRPVEAIVKKLGGIPGSGPTTVIPMPRSEETLCRQQY